MLAQWRFLWRSTIFHCQEATPLPSPHLHCTLVFVAFTESYSSLTYFNTSMSLAHRYRGLEACVVRQPHTHSPPRQDCSAVGFLLR